jgi:hypothetical protein
LDITGHFLVHAPRLVGVCLSVAQGAYSSAALPFWQSVRLASIHHFRRCAPPSRKTTSGAHRRPPP